MGAKVLVALGRYAAFQQRPVEPPVSFPDVDAGAAAALIQAARQSGKRWLSVADGCALLTCYGISVARYRSAATVAECLAAADALGYPVVLKVDAETMIHKTESGGVVLDIRDPTALRQQAERLVARHAAAAPRLLVQEQLSGGHEVIVGAKALKGLGHVVMFGLGGIYAEVFKDVSFRITPVTPREAAEMVQSLRSFPLLAGVRGQRGVDVGALTETIQRVSQMLTDHPSIQELDINPIFAFPDSVRAADVRVMI